MVVKQFEVWLVELNPTRGSEINKTRPCLIISPDGMNKTLPTVIVAPLMHTVKNYPTRVDCSFKGESGQIVLDQIRSVDKTRLTKRMGKLDAATSKDVCTLLQVMFQFTIY